jgi:hypothetical protein
MSSKETLVRSWGAHEAWLTPQEFAAQLHSSTYAPLLGCDSWRACSTMVSHLAVCRTVFVIPNAYAVATTVV